MCVHNNNNTDTYNSLLVATHRMMSGINSERACMLRVEEIVEGLDTDLKQGISYKEVLVIAS